MAHATAPTHLTIGRLAREAGVGVETIRYYQQRQLLPVPPGQGGYRQYPLSLVDRIRFIKRAQELGFSLEEIGELLQLDERIDKRGIRHLASLKVTQIQQKVADLQRMQAALEQLVSHCSRSHAGEPCPIIASLSGAMVAPLPDPG